MNNFFYNNDIFLHIMKKIVDKYYYQETSLIHIILTLFINNNNNNNKFEFIKENLNNIFYSNTIKDDFLESICRTQKVYFGLIKLKNIYLYKKSKTQIDTDMCLNPIDTIKKNCMKIYQNKKIYWFLIRDLVNIINTALSNSPNFFSEPLISKNPYNNIPFNKSTLYNIYFNIRYSGIKMPELIEKFFLVNFDLSIFENKYEYLIREYALNNYIRNSQDSILVSLIELMIKSYNKGVKSKYNIVIHDEFPETKLIKIMKPCLLLFLKINYSLIEIEKVNSAVLLKNMLLNQSKTYPSFGRKIYKIEKYYKDLSSTKKSSKILIYFNDKHINFYNIIQTNNNNINNNINNNNNNNTNYFELEYYFPSENIDIYEEIDVSDDEELESIIESFD